MTVLDPWYEARRLMCEALEEDLLGPEDEPALKERPLSRFAIGILYPQSGSAVGDDLADGGAVVDDEDPLGATDVEVAAPGDVSFDPAVALAHVRYPSSLGLTFAVAADATDEVVVDVTADRYLPIEAEAPSTGDEQEAAPEEDPAAFGDGEDRVKQAQWRREGYAREGLSVDLRTVGARREQLTDGLVCHIVVRSPRDGAISVTVSLVNANRTAKTGDRDEKAWLRPQIVVRSAAPFVDRPTARAHGIDDEDLATNALLFRDVPNLAVGHGCSVTWADDGPVTELRTTFLPTQALRLAEPSGGRGPKGEELFRLDMEELARDRTYGNLRALAADYRRWIEQQATRIAELPEEHRPTAETHLENAREAARRIEAGIDLLASDALAAQAFALMNVAMQQQRDRQEQLRAEQNATEYVPGRQAWRPFQIAFILLNLVGLTDMDSSDRDVADLLWFPTGGGKTEAYLGAIAYVTLLRRLRNPAHGGVSVLMRYTLRLLTTQQFERAAGLICAVEIVRRREMPDAAPISLGLWVGQSATPNRVLDADKALRKLAHDEEPEEGNPMQLLKCPWCGKQLSHREYIVSQPKDRLTVRCADPECEFGSALPVHLTDEDVYRERPSLVIGTVDKFAMMAWREEASTLFSTDGRHPAPDLIVQDELHLISGPLGTLVGLYETAVDAATTRDARPKVIASTATIRRARSQVRAVFDRESKQFPPPGIDHGDSYFAREASPSTKGTRLYLGVLAPGISHATLLVRTYAALLQRAKSMQVSNEVRDAYWTLLGYFNSLRVLGGSYMQVIDDVPDRMKLVARRNDEELRAISEPRELTSRKKSAEIPQELEILGKPWTSTDAADVVLATNMISVGVDVDRLGLMAVMGQPQTTAEYIQATSRVGRRYPGLVVVLYNAARSRDLSHYENFTSYHRALDREVEATGATPFAARARDRGLHGVLVAMARMLVPGLGGSDQAGRAHQLVDALKQQIDAVVSRAESVAPEEAEAVRAQLHDVLGCWVDAAEEGTVTTYEGWRSSDEALLVPAGGRGEENMQAQFPVGEPAWSTLTSLRNVDTETELYVISDRKKGKKSGS
jgi:hypothetical protein